MKKKDLQRETEMIKLDKDTKIKIGITIRIINIDLEMIIEVTRTINIHRDSMNTGEKIKEEMTIGEMMIIERTDLDQIIIGNDQVSKFEH